MREIKFRKWHKGLEDMTFWDGSMGSNNLFWHTLTEFPDMYHLMQYTGLNDKNGKEIYEGDILNGGASKHGVVTFENGTFAVWGTPLGWDVEGLGYEEQPEILLPEKWAIVIGNIYENSELINTKETVEQ